MTQPDSQPPSADFWQRHHALRGRLEWIGWAAVFVLVACANTAVHLMEAVREGRPMALWQPASWELSSAAIALALLPALSALCERWPLHADTWRRRLPGYVLASLGWSALHVLGMVALRKLVYAGMGQQYQFGPWLHWFGYEYLKDIRTFALIVLLMHAYRWFWRRLQGEARLLDEPDQGMPDHDGADGIGPDGKAKSGPIERPERFLVRKLGREFLVAANDIEWIQASGNYVNLRVRGHDYPLRSTIAGIEARLDPSRFAKIHRSYIVNLDQIVSIETLDTGDARIHLKDGGTLPCSRRHRDSLRGRTGAAG